MKKPKFKLLTEFKDFITRGSVLDLAVGMIIGAAFTAIVTALVNSIFKPLINAIPMGGIEGLITMLVPKDAAGATLTESAIAAGAAVDLSKSVYIDWGAFIMAIINFLLTALVLFAIIKAINTARDFGKKSSERIKKQLEKGKISEEEAAAKQAELDAQAEEAAKEEPAPVDPTVELLKEIRDLLLAQKNDAAVAKMEEIGVTADTEIE